MLLDAGLAGWDSGDYGCIAEVGARALALPRGDDREQQLLADVLAAVGALSQGDPTPPVLEEIARTEDVDEPRLLVWAALGATVAGERAIEGALLKRAAGRARSSGAVDMLTLVLEGATVQGFLAGEYAVGVEATEGLRLARDAGLSNAASLHLASLTWLAAVRGRDHECRAHAAAVRESAWTTGAALANSIAEWGLALLDLGAGRPEHAATRLEALRAAPSGVGHPLYVLSSAPDLVEACVRSGRHDAARAAYEGVAGFARPGAPAWTLALAARCRALLAQDGEAEREFAAALLIHPADHRPYDRARMQLLLGEHLRRQRQRVEAREHLRPAIETFEALGAAPWAERARAELRASGETARRRDPSTLEQLTPQELQVARLVGEGLSNKEVAAQLFLSPRTIDAHLRRVFTKLGVTSRTQLARTPLGVAG
jgi:DNA-binding CsgD family transcriptional regulator